MKLLGNRGFTKFIIDNEDPVISVKILSYVMSHSLLKPQRLLLDDDDYYVAIDMYTNTYYICYRDLMMIDIDRYKSKDDTTDTLNDIKVKLSNYPELFFRIYSSRNGYHIFVINKSMNYKSDESIKLMYDLGCDYYYIVYSYLRGWSVRLNKKKGEENIDKLYSWVGDVVKGCFFSSDITSQINLQVPSDNGTGSASPDLLDLEQIKDINGSSNPQQIKDINGSSNLQQIKDINGSSNPQQIKDINRSSNPEQIKDVDGSGNLQQTEDINGSCNLEQIKDVDGSGNPQQTEDINGSSNLEDIMPDIRLEHLTDLHINLVDLFVDVGLCSMPAPISNESKTKKMD